MSEQHPEVRLPLRAGGSADDAATGQRKDYQHDLRRRPHRRRAGLGRLRDGEGGVSTLTRAMAKELVGEGILVNGVAPGVITTPFHDRFTPPTYARRWWGHPYGT